MVRLLVLTSLAVLVTTVALAAPGLGNRPYLPDPVEFDLRAPSAPAGVAAARGFVSPPVRAPKRFNLVGLAWRGRREVAIALRVRRDGGAWSRWTPASGHDESASDPIWGGEADWVQYRMSRRVPGLRLHFVNTTGSATPRDRLLTALRRTAATVVRGVPALAAEPRPRIRPRGDWGGEKCPPRRVSYGRVRAALVHHTVTANQYTRAQVPAALLAICRFHRNTNGWDDIGYNFLVDRFGQIWEGRAGGVDEAVVGAQAQGYNSQTTGISNLGTFTAAPQSEAAIAAMARLIRWKLTTHGVPTFGKTTLVSAGGGHARYPRGAVRRFARISGHRDTGRTACPGLQLYRQLPDLRERVGEERPSGEPLTIEGSLPAQVAYAPDGVTLGGRLRSSDGSAVGGLTVELQSLGSSGWRTLATAPTDGDGAFSAQVKLRRQTILRWKFAGDELYRPYRGDGVALAVVPVISLFANPDSTEPGAEVTLSGTIGPAKRTSLALTVQREQAGVWQTVDSGSIAVSAGRFSSGYSFGEPGSFRIQVSFGGDRSNPPSASPWVPVTVQDLVLPL